MEAIPKTIMQDKVHLLRGNDLKSLSPYNVHPHCPYYTTKDVLEQKHYSDYELETQKVIDLITLSDDIEPVGSSKYKVHKYPSDIDLFEPVIGCCTINAVRLPMANKIKNIIENIQKEQNIYFSRFQCGYDRRYDIYWGEERNGKVIDFDPFIAKREIRNLRRQELLNEDEFQNAMKLVKDNPTVSEYLKLYYFFRRFMALDWNESEILRGYKEARGNKHIYLDDSLIDNSLVKLDIWAELPYPDMKNKKRYVEITNWFLVQVKDSLGDVQTLSIVQQDRIKSLRADIYKYNSDKYFDPLKASKRYWNYLLELKMDFSVESELKKLASLFSSYIAFLNSVATDIELSYRMLRYKITDRNYYNRFISDTENRLINYAPSCYFNETINNKLLKSLDLMEFQSAIDNLTVKYLDDNKIDMIRFIEDH